MDNYFTKKEQIVILVLVIVIVFMLGFKFLNKSDEKLEIENAKNTDAIVVENVPEERDIEEAKEIMIHISGAVYNPGIVKLESGKRLLDATELAGGLKKDADLDKINLAKKLQDEDKVYIPKIGEDIEIESVDIISSQSDTSSAGKIDINCCSKEELMTLPGIGDATAKKIIDYRSDTSFKKIEDIMEVSGIGEKKFSSIKEFIIVK